MKKIQLNKESASRCFREILEDVVVRRVIENIECIFVEIFVNIPSIKNISRRQFSENVSS